jgi:hypothetical protein
MQRFLSFLRLLTVSVLVLFTTGWILPSFADDAILDVKKDGDKTVYTIDSKEEAPQADKEKAWDMLKNGNILIDQRGESGKGQDNSSRRRR